MLPVLIGAVIGAVAYSCLSDDKETETYSNGEFKRTGSEQTQKSF